MTEDVRRSHFLQSGNVVWCINYILIKPKWGNTSTPVSSKLETLNSYCQYDTVSLRIEFYIYSKSVHKKTSPCSPQALILPHKVSEPFRKNKQSTIPSRPQSERLSLVKTSSVWFDVAFATLPVGSQHLVHVRAARPVVIRLPLKLLVLPLEEAKLWGKHNQGYHICEKIEKKHQTKPTDTKLRLSPSTAVPRREPAAADRQWRCQQSPPPGRRPSHQVYWLSAAPAQKQLFQGLYRKIKGPLYKNFKEAWYLRKATWLHWHIGFF